MKFWSRAVRILLATIVATQGAAFIPAMAASQSKRLAVKAIGIEELKSEYGAGGGGGGGDPPPDPIEIEVSAQWYTDYGFWKQTSSDETGPTRIETNKIWEQNNGSDFAWTEAQAQSIAYSYSCSYSVSVTAGLESKKIELEAGYKRECPITIETRYVPVRLGAWQKGKVFVGKDAVYLRRNYERWLHQYTNNGQRRDIRDPNGQTGNSQSSKTETVASLVTSPLPR